MKFAAPAALALALVFAAGGVAAKTLTPQQQRMSTCSKDAHAKGLKGAAYKSFMSTCLKGGSAMPASHSGKQATTQQQRMKTCNAEAKSRKLKGAARKSFMSSCLKGGSTMSAAPVKKAKATSKKTAQQEKMKACNAEARSKKLKGAARKSFMSKCLKG